MLSGRWSVPRRRVYSEWEVVGALLGDDGLWSRLAEEDRA